MCFWFRPPSLRGKEESLDYSERLAKVGFLPPTTGLWLTQLREQMQLVYLRHLLALGGMACPFTGLLLLRWGCELEKTNLSSLLWG